MALTDNLVAYYKMDGNSNDSVGSNNGTDTSVSYVTGKMGSAASFNGSTSKITLSNTSTITNQFTFAGWINTTSSSRQAIFVKGDGLSNATSSWTFEYGNTANKLTLMIAVGGINYIVSGSISIPTNTWVYVAGTYNGSTLSLYINGVLDSTASASGNVNNISATTTLGFFGDYASLPFSGQIDEFAVWSRALPIDEISQIFNSGRGNSYPLTATPSLYGAVSGWRLDDSSGGATDVIGYRTLSNANVTYGTGKINNGAVFNGFNGFLSSTSYINNLSSVSVSCWIKTTYSGGIYDQTIFRKDIFEGSRSLYGITFNRDAGSAGKVSVLSYNTSLYQVNSSSTINDGNWHHIVGVFNSVSNQKLYVDGALQGSSPCDNLLASSRAEIALGGQVPSQANTIYFNGSLDEVFVFGRELTQSEVTQLYNGGAGLQYPFVSTAKASFLLKLI